MRVSSRWIQLFRRGSECSDQPVKTYRLTVLSISIWLSCSPDHCWEYGLGVCINPLVELISLALARATNWFVNLNTVIRCALYLLQDWQCRVMLAEEGDWCVQKVQHWWGGIMVSFQWDNSIQLAQSHSTSNPAFKFSWGGTSNSTVNGIKGIALLSLMLWVTVADPLNNQQGVKKLKTPSVERTKLPIKRVLSPERTCIISPPPCPSSHVTPSLEGAL